MNRIISDVCSFSLSFMISKGMYQKDKNASFDLHVTKQYTFVKYFKSLLINIGFTTYTGSIKSFTTNQTLDFQDC